VKDRKWHTESIRDTLYVVSTSELLTRGVANVIPRDLAEEKLKSGKPLRIYLGIDPTGAKLHLGHTVPLRKLQQFADAGHRVTLVIGSFTAMIGDPSGRDEMREPLTQEQIEENFRTYKEQASTVLDFHKVELAYNHEWLGQLKPEKILELASHFTKQQMEQRDMFVRREKEGKPVFIHEFLYPLFVGYDSVHLDVDCELGATDQEFNMLAGRTLQKVYGKNEKFVLTVKIIEGTDGRKMSKTYNNCIYLEDSPKEMFGKVMSMKDEYMETYFECCTGVPTDEYNEFLKGNPRDAKARLASEIVTLYHGIDSAKKAAENFTKVFTEKGIPDDMPEVTVEKGSLLIDVLVEHKLVSSKSDARRLVKQGGITMNDKPVANTETEVEEGIVRVGKRKFMKLKLT
ncbi:tyrosine--tRNA ligase, partial [Candidatus Peregrinibacteria bacterium CG22_combo_CG10-13_8_21_14_all_49_11]